MFIIFSDFAKIKYIHTESDMLSKYDSLYVRLGSKYREPDGTPYVSVYHAPDKYSCIGDYPLDWFE